MKNFHREYDLTLAIVALHFLWHHDYESDEEQSLCLSGFVWKPQERFLFSIAKHHPKQVNCFFGPQRRFPEKLGAACQNIYAVNNRSQVAYLGTVFSPKAIIKDRQRMKQEDQKFLKRFALDKIVRDKCFCIIPSGTDVINESTLIKAVKKLFKSFETSPIPEIAQLAKADIALFSSEKGEKIEREIKQLAQLPKPPLLEDYTEFFQEFAHD